MVRRLWSRARRSIGTPATRCATKRAPRAGENPGSALFADKIFSRPLITGVLSGGWIENVAAPVANGYGDVSYYNPLFLFRDWLVENNPYVYASAKNGNGNWSDTRVSG